MTEEGKLELRKTALHERHLQLGGRMVAFAGFSLPVEYTGVVDEHLSVRRDVGIFDVSHMGEISISGEGALDYLNRAITNDASRLDPFQAQYTVMLNDEGGIIDDFVVYRRERDYLLVVNAANTGRAFRWLAERAPGGTHVENLSAQTGQIAVQGPKAEALTEAICGDDISNLGYFRSKYIRIGGVTALISRTGYTGEDGFEIYVEAERAGGVWDKLMESAPTPKPCGLGARNTLRLEMAFKLHGSDIDESTTPLEAGLGWLVKLDKGDFFGKRALLRQKESGITRKLVGLRLDARRVPRPGLGVLSGGTQVGQVTSAGFSPSLGVGIALAYVETEYARPGTDLVIDIRGQPVKARLEKGPFYKKGSHK